MSRARLASAIAAAAEAGILPHDAVHSVHAARPWPVILLTGFGAWLAAIPFIGLIFVALGAALGRGAAPYVIGIFFVLGATAVMRRKDAPLFLEQLTFPLLLAGGGMIGVAIIGDMARLPAGLVLMALAVAIAAAVPRRWLRILLGATACGLLIYAATGKGRDEAFHFWLALHGVLLLWIAASVRVQAPLVSAMAGGWLCATLAGLAIWSGVTFLAGAQWHADGGPVLRAPWSTVTQMVSAVMALAAAAWLLRAWPALRAPWAWMAGVILVALAGLMPSLGAALLVVSVCAVQQRWTMASAAGVAAAWIVGAFYYQLSYPLGIKALMLCGAGALLGAIAWLALRGKRAVAPTPASDSRVARWAIAASAIAVLVVANTAILQKETLIAEGRPVFLELAPVDPRSLMQGDYMRLAYGASNDSAAGREWRLDGAERLRITGVVNERGIFTRTRIGPDLTAGPGEIVVQLSPTQSGWTIASDAWYFQEGEAKRWEKARYGEFRVDQQGRALLVGLRGPALEAL